jgi:hypothetical protein
MWWNFVARTRSEIEESWREWDDGAACFGRVASDLERILAPRPTWLPGLPGGERPRGGGCRQGRRPTLR